MGAPLTILGDRDVSRILHSLTKEDVLAMQQSMGDALHWYSTSNDANDCCSDFQPERTALKRKDGSTTLFVPASGMDGQSVKVMNVIPPDSGGLGPALENMSITTADSRSSISTQSPRSSFSMSTVETNDTRRSSSSLPTSVSEVVNSSGRASLASKDSGGPSTSNIRGSLTLFDKLGNTTGLINAEEVTAFRTALCSTMLLKKRHSVHDLTVFGAGKQAYWHLRLALLLRGSEIHHVNVITRNFESARKCIMRLYNPQPDDPNFQNPIGAKYNNKTKTTILTPQHTEYQRLLKEYVRASNVIFCTVPSDSPLFPASHLTNPEGRKKGRYIVAIGSYKPSMIELHPDIIRYAVAPHHEHRHFHKRQQEGGAIIVDTVSGCLRDAGEVVQAKLTPDQVVELGELFMLRRDADRRLHEKGGKAEQGCHFQDSNHGLMEWLTRGNVIYKSVGLGLMDVVVGQELVQRAQEQGIGTTVHDF